MRSHRGADVLIGVALPGNHLGTRAIAGQRLCDLGRPAWVYRSVHFLAALGRGDWAQTLLVGHPGVVTNVAGCHRPGLAPFRGTHYRAVRLAGRFRAGRIGRPRRDGHSPPGRASPAAKSFLPLAHALLAGALWALLRKLLDRPSALAAVSS